MANTIPQGEYRFWEKEADTTWERLVTRYLDKKLVTISQEGGDILSKLKVLPTISVLEPRWGYEYDYPMQITARLTGITGSGTSATGTLTFSGYLFGEAIESKHVQRVIRTDTILRAVVPATYAVQHVQVTSVNGLVASVRAYGNTTMTAEDAAGTWYIGGSPWPDTRDAEEPRNLERGLRSCGTRRIVDNFKITDTAKNISYELITNPVKHELDALVRRMRNEFADAVINERPYYDGTAYRFGTYTDKPTLAGILWWTDYVQSQQANTNIYVNNSGAKVTYNQICNLAASVEKDELANFNTGQWGLVVGKTTRRYMNTYKETYRVMDSKDRKIGWAVESMELDNGLEVGIVSDWRMDDTSTLFCDLSKMGWGYFQNGQLKRGQIPVASILYEQWMVAQHVYGVKCDNPREIGRIYGCPATYTA